MQKLRIVTVGISGGRSLTRPFRDARRISLDTVVDRSEGCTYDADVWDLFMTHFLSPRVPNLSVTIRNFFHRCPTLSSRVHRLPTMLTALCADRLCKPVTAPGHGLWAAGVQD